eukprot:1597010-Pyramimonas_sp.AAC.1
MHTTHKTQSAGEAVVGSATNQHGRSTSCHHRTGAEYPRGLFWWEGGRMVNARTPSTPKS